MDPPRHPHRRSRRARRGHRASCTGGRRSTAPSELACSLKPAAIELAPRRRRRRGLPRRRHRGARLDGRARGPRDRARRRAHPPHAGPTARRRRAARPLHDPRCRRVQRRAHRGRPRRSPVPLLVGGPAAARRHRGTAPRHAPRPALARPGAELLRAPRPPRPHLQRRLLEPPRAPHELGRRDAAGSARTGRSASTTPGCMDAWPAMLSRHMGDQPRVELRDHPAVARLCRNYLEQLRAAGLAADEAIPYRFARQRRRHAGRPAGPPALARGRCSRTRPDPQTELPPSPFAADGGKAWVGWLRSGPVDRVGRYLHHLWEESPDLQRSFPDLTDPIDRARYCAWVVRHSTETTEIPPTLLPDHEDTLMDDQTDADRPASSTAAPRRPLPAARARDRRGPRGARPAGRRDRRELDGPAHRRQGDAGPRRTGRRRSPATSPPPSRSWPPASPSSASGSTR